MTDLVRLGPGLVGFAVAVVVGGALLGLKRVGRSSCAGSTAGRKSVLSQHTAVAA